MKLNQLGKHAIHNKASIDITTLQNLYESLAKYSFKLNREFGHPQQNRAQPPARHTQYG